MKVKLLTSRVTAHASQLFGDVIEVEDDEGARMIDGGLAEAVDGEPSAAPAASPPEPETMTVEPTRDAAMPTPRRRGRPRKVRTE